MKKVLCLFVVFCGIIGVLYGCHQDNNEAETGSASLELQITEATTETTAVLPTTEMTTVSSATEGTLTEDTTIVSPTEPSETVPATEPSATVPATEPSTTVPTTQPTTETTSPTTDATDGKENNTSSVTVIAGGEWDHGPVTWQVTSDGVLTISGNTHIQAKQSYIWKDNSEIVTRIVIEDGITSIPEYAFSGMTNVSSVYIGNTVTQIGKGAFAQCRALSSIKIPASVNKIDASAFDSCTGMTKVEFADGSQLNEIGTRAFAQSGITSFTSPASLRIIEISAFANCTSLQNVSLQGGVSTLKAKAFEGCSGLKHLILGESITDVGGYAFDGCNGLVKLENYSTALHSFTNCPNLSTVVEGGSRTVSGHYEGCTALSSVTFKAPIKQMRAHAFEGCTSLKTLSIPGTVTIIDAGAFRGSGITSIRIPESVTKIELLAFGDSKLQEITFVGNAPAMGIYTNVFANVSATAYYPVNNETWTDEVRQNYGGSLVWVAN